MKPGRIAPVPRICLTREEAAAAIGVSLSHFERHVQPHLRLIFTGSARLVSVRELEQWAERSSTLAGGASLRRRLGADGGPTELPKRPEVGEAPEAADSAQ